MPRPVHEQLADTRGPFDCRSEPTQSEVSSHISRPKWRRMLRATASLLSKTLTASGKDEDVWIYPDATGGGMQADFSSLLSSLLEACDIGDEASGTVLIGMYTLLQAHDLPMTAQTWRVLIVTAMLISVKVDISDRTMSAQAEARLRDAVVHWWPKANADKALRAFTGRPNFNHGRLAPSLLAECYFKIRDTGLEMENDDSSASAVCSVSQAPRKHHASLPQRRSGSGGSSLRSSGGDLDVSQPSLRLSDDSSAIDEEMGQDPRFRDDRKSASTISL